MKRIVVLLLVFSVSNLIAQTKLDSIQELIKLSKDGDLLINDRVRYAQQASEMSEKLAVDTTILRSNRNLSMIYFVSESFPEYVNINHKNFELAEKLKDSVVMAISANNLASYFHVDAKIDSAFYHYSKALKLYSNLNNIRKKAVVLLNIADIQETERDYIGSEVNAIESIKLLSSLPIDESIRDELWILNNLIGIISLKLKNYDKSLEYHEKALDIANEMNFGYFNRLYSLNNQAFVYRKKGDYDKALSLYRSTLKGRDLFIEDPEFYALILGNIAFTEHLNESGTNNSIEKQFYDAYRISDSLNDPITKLGITIDLAKYYRDLKEIDSSLKYADESKALAMETLSNDILLEAYKILADLNKDDEMGRFYLNKHIRLSDSLLDEERAKRNKFARIEFETDQILAENEQISKERLIFLLSSVGLLVTLILLYVIISQRAKNKELEFNKVQQEANEEIYNLMLAQQDKVDEGRTQEKKRISEELHDGILGRLFGTRLSLDSLNFVHTDDAVKTRSQYIEELKSIEQEIRKISHDLNTDFVSGSSFSDIIQTLIETQTNAYQLSYEYHEDDEIDWDELSNKTKIHIYRMLQETMQNIYKHANAKHIKISFRLKNNVILLTVEDDGSGFNTNKARKGIGLKNFDSRAGEIGGKVEIFSNPGEGTKVVIHVPTE